MLIKEPWFTKVFKPLVFILSLLPLAYMVYGFFADILGANPIETLTRDTGEWALRFLLLTLLLSPLRRIFNWAQAIRLRRMMGLYTYFYAIIHLTTYLWLDQFFDWEEILYDIIDRPFITVGMLSFLLLTPLAITSTKSMIRRLGKTWKRLHQLVYVIPILAVLHFWWLVKADVTEPVIYAALFTIVIGERLIRVYNPKRRN